MSLYQNSVIKKYLKGIETAKVDEAWEKFTAHFHNKAIQENIRNSKEEQYQGEFLIDLFVNVFGYTKNPTPNFNLTTELKNVKGAKKTDGAILKDEKALAVIELKGTNTTDLAKVENQAFGYKNNQPGCIYVITSNFEKLRFYIDNAVDFEEFNLFQITRERFEVLWLCLSSEYLLKNTPKQIKDESLTQEENITKKLYKDYSQFRNDIFDSIQKNNPNYDKLTLFKKTQKLLDRFLFIFFAEDRLLLPPNSIREIINQWTDLRDKYDEYFPLYDRFKKYFGYMNTGYKGKKHDIFAYNGGLFATDEILDNITIDDNLLYKHTQILSNYDFESEVSVNILGHIFEHSLNEIEEIQAELEGIATDKSKSKRKKDGVFYTPKYITKYIVDNTVGKLCAEKKADLDIDEAEYEKDRKGRKKATLKALIKKLEDYRKWLLQLTICDPACGSGAFLNQALEFLINEHQYIDELNAKLLGEAMILSDIENSILENNLFGVDINEESVEIAKLSLWLRTAQKGRKLTTLNNNIKCGNSLIDDVEVAGDKAFDWQNEFPTVFEKGGFDVVIGNPPYVGIQGIEWDDRRYYETKFKTATGRFDLYTLFIEKGMSLKKVNGAFAFIIPGKILNNRQFSTARKIVAKNHNVIVVKIDDKVFDEAQVNSVILLNYFNKLENTYQAVNLNRDIESIISNALVKDILKDDLAIFRLEIDEKTDLLIAKIKNNTVQVKEIAEVKDGVVAGGIKDILFLKNKINNSCYKLHFGKHLKRYTIFESDVWIDYRPQVMMEEEVRRKNGKRAGLWMRDEKIFKRKKILTRFVGKEIIGFYDDIGLYYEHTLHSTFVTDDRVLPKFLLALYNSKLINYYYKKTNSKGGNIFPQVRISSVEKLPIKIVDSTKQLELVSLVEIIENITKEQTKLVSQFSKYLQSQYSLEKLTKKLQNWYELEFGNFIKELNKIIKKEGREQLSKMDEMEWMEIFEVKKSTVQNLKTKIDITDKEIDQMVYELYGLTEEEIKIVEEATA
jgi:type I restriction-modification system DNA methylase subunit